jgi:hypothetical protein
MVGRRMLTTKAGKNGDSIGAASNITEMLVPEVGLEPTQGCPYRILSPARLPFHHSGTIGVNQLLPFDSAAACSAVTRH